jgi:hypothetical protein
MLWMIGCMDYTIEEPKISVLPEEADSSILTDEELDGSNDTSDVVEEEIAQAKIYANTSGELYEINPDNGEVILIGVFTGENGPVDHFEDIAIDLSGHMYGGTGEYLYLINPSNAEVREICPLLIDTTAMTFTSDNQLIIGTENTLQLLDKDDCSMQPIISASFYDTSGDIVGLPDGYLYWSVYGGSDEGDRLVRVDPVTGTEELVGEIGAERLYGMGFADNQLFGFSSDGSILRIDNQEAQSTILIRHEGKSWWGATTNPVVWE